MEAEPLLERRVVDIEEAIPTNTKAYFTVRLGDANALLLSGPSCDQISSEAATAASHETVRSGAGEEVGAEVGSDGVSTTSGYWDFIDVDPFGSCLPFLEAAVGGVRDGGVLAVAATDLTVLCGKGKGAKVCVCCASLDNPVVALFTRCFQTSSTSGKTVEIRFFMPSI